MLIFPAHCVRPDVEGGRLRRHPRRQRAQLAHRPVGGGDRLHRPGTNLFLYSCCITEDLGDGAINPKLRTPYTWT